MFLKKNLNIGFDKIIKCLVLIIFVFSSHKSYSQSVAWTRASQLHDGMNYCYLDEYWLGNPSINYSDYLNLGYLPTVKTQLQLISSMGFETIRLPVTFDKWEDRIAPYSIDSVNYFKAIDSIITWCNQYNLFLVIDYHYGNLYDFNYNSELPRVVDIWKEIAIRLAGTNPNKVFFELYNEPNAISDLNWRNAAIAMINTMRPILPNHTFIVGANDYNSLYQLFSMGVLPDANIIYTFHFYEPMVFTHQGATWVSNAVSTTGVPFPYDPATMPQANPLVNPTLPYTNYSIYDYAYDGTCAALYNSLLVARSFSSMYNVPIWCGEFGSYKVYAPADDSRCRYTECVKNNLDALYIPYAYWEWDATFSIFNGYPSLANLPLCMQNAFDIIASPLPVELVYFGGYNEEENNFLQWTTASEVNNYYFEVERSLDLKTFNKIGKILGSGTTSFQHTYAFTDINAPAGIAYYRIKQFDFNGDFEYTYIISIERRTNALTAKIFPNPANNLISIVADEKLNWEISSLALGNILIRQDNTLEVDISSLPEGIYVVKLFNSMNEFLSSQKFVKE